VHCRHSAVSNDSFSRAQKHTTAAAPQVEENQEENLLIFLFMYSVTLSWKTWKSQGIPKWSGKNQGK